MPSSYASFEQRLPPTAPSHSVACALTSPAASSTSYPSSRGLLLSHLVTARGDTLQIWQVRKQADTHDADPAPQLYHVQTKSFFGVITGLQATRTIESDTDGKDRLVVSFKDAKIALLEWDEVGQTLATVSIHTYERASQLVGKRSQPRLTAAPPLTLLLAPLHCRRTALRSTTRQSSQQIPRIAVQLFCSLEMRLPSCPLRPRRTWTSWTTSMISMKSMGIAAARRAGATVRPAT